MRILFISYNIGKTASGIVSERILIELLKQGHEVKVIVESNELIATIPCHISVVRNIFAEGSTLFRIWYKLVTLFYDPFNLNYLWRYRAYRKAKKILEDWNPDFIYCRTSPIDPCFVGIKLKKKFAIPLVSNLTDPIPAPVEYLPLGRLRNILICQSKEIVDQSDLVGMGTQQAIDYQLRLLEKDDDSLFFVSPDTVPSCDLKYVERKSSNSFRLLYLGAIYGSRNIDPLINAIKRLRNEGVEAVLEIYGGRVSLPEKVSFVRCYEPTSDIDSLISEVDVLVDLDGDDAEPVFMSSKLKQYLVYDRPILSITPENSPTSILLRDLCTANVTKNQVDSILDAIKSINAKQYLSEDYYERLSIIRRFSQEKVVKNLLTQVENKIFKNRLMF